MGKVKVGQADRAALADRAIVAVQAAGMQQGQIFKADQAVWMPYHAEVYLANVQTFGSGTTPAVVAWDTVESDPNFNISGLGTIGFKYTAPLAGRYFVAAVLAWGGSQGKASGLYVYVNGVQARIGPNTDTANGAFVIAISTIVRVSATGQSIDVRAIEQNGSNLGTNVGSNNCWAVFEYRGSL